MKDQLYNYCEQDVKITYILFVVLGLLQRAANEKDRLITDGKL